MPRLVVSPDSTAPWEIQLKPGPNLIGRSITNHFQIRDPSVSGTHCQILVSDGSAQIKDLGSTNGTFVNRAPVTEAPLPPGCSIRLGDVELRFYSDVAAPVAALVTAEPASPGFGVPPVSETLMPHQATTALPTPGTLRPLQRCRFHPAMPARFVCAQCGHYFCEACVARRNAAGSTENFCRHCGIPCAPVQVQFETVAERGFFQCLPGAFAYPLRGAGIIIVIVGIVLVGLIKAGQALFRFGTIRTLIFGIILEIFAGGYLFSYLQGIVHSTEAEDRELPDLPGISNFLEDVIIPFFRFLGLTLFCFGPAIGCAIWLGVSRTPDGYSTQAYYLFLTATAFGYIYYPMAFLAVATMDSVTAANPLVVVPSMAKVPVKYLISLLPLACMSALQWLGPLLLNRLFPEGWTTHAMGEFLAMIGVMALLAFLSLYLLVVAVHLLGLIFVTTKSELGWLRR
jgi:FHA domain